MTKKKYITAGIIKNPDPPTKEKFAKLRAIAEKKEEQEKKKKKPENR